MANTTIAVLIILLIGAGIVALQIFLSRRESRFWGWILPFLFFLYSLLVIFSLRQPDSSTMFSMVAMVVLSFIMANIPTLVFLLIYFACREKLHQKNQLEKMNIQDLN